MTKFMPGSPYFPRTNRQARMEDQNLRVPYHMLYHLRHILRILSI